jgi:hypothetical protein
MNFRAFLDQGLFGIPQMTASINRIPYAPRLIQALGIYEDKPVNTTTPIIERRFGTRQVIDAAPFGVRRNTYDVPNRDGAVMKTWSLNLSSFVSKQDTVGIRRFGTMDAETVASVLSDRMEWMRQDSLESTIENWRMQALMGVINNTDGSNLINWYNFFGVTPTTANFSTATNGSAVQAYCKGIKDSINDALQGIPCTGFVGILGDAAWEAFFASPDIKEAGKYRTTGDQTMATAFTTEVPGAPNPNQTSINWGALANIFTFGGITFMNYRSSVDFPTSKAVFFPLGVRDMFQSVLSPSSLIEEQGEMGQGFYAKTWDKEDGSGIGIYIESNRIEVNALPEACIQATFGA